MSEEKLDESITRVVNGYHRFGHHPDCCVMRRYCKEAAFEEIIQA
jgi:hypothetical protein